MMQHLEKGMQVVALPIQVAHICVSAHALHVGAHVAQHHATVLQNVAAMEDDIRRRNHVLKEARCELQSRHPKGHLLLRRRCGRLHSGTRQRAAGARVSSSQLTEPELGEHVLDGAQHLSARRAADAEQLRRLAILRHAGARAQQLSSRLHAMARGAQVVAARKGREAGSVRDDATICTHT